jgi:hypothetical protein
MKKVAATRGQTVSLADFFGRDADVEEPTVGGLATANFYVCLDAIKRSSIYRPRPEIRHSRIRVSRVGVKQVFENLLSRRSVPLLSRIGC